MITSDGPLAAADTAAEDLRLLRRYEPVLRFTQGELFLPMPVESYLSQCSLWRLAGPGRKLRGRRPEERLCSPGEFTPDLLSTVSASWPGRDLSLRFVAEPLGRREFRAWRRDKARARLAPGSSRFAYKTRKTKPSTPRCAAATPGASQQERSVSAIRWYRCPPAPARK